MYNPDAEYDTALREIDELNLVLNESHKLLKHYAQLLNDYDNGRRRIPNTVEEWKRQVLKR